MKKHKVIACTVLFSLLLGSFSSCKEELENKLNNDTYADTFWKTQSDVNSAVLGAYGLLRRSLYQNSAFFIWGDGAVGLFNSDQGTLATDLVTGGSFTVPYWTDGAHNWTNWYQVIDASNLVLENVNAMPDNVFKDNSKDNLLGEAYFLRALSYFYMTRVWGNVPLQLKATTSADQTERMGQADAKEVVQQVIADAQKASSLLSWENTTTYERRRANKGSALALLAHAHAWANEYEKTVVYADSLIARRDLFLLQPQKSIRSVFSTSASSENIFVITSREEENESAAHTGSQFTTNIAFLTVSNEQKVSMPYNPAYYYCLRERINGLYGAGNEDTRKAEFFFESNAGTNRDKFSLKKYSDIIYKNPATNSDPRAESNLVIFRLADIILLKAEALNALSRDGEALLALNEIRSRAGVPALASTGTALQRIILEERQRELIGEGHNYFDIVRNAVNRQNINLFSQLTLWTMSQDRFAQKGYLWPISNTILNSNRLISQTPWWMGKV